MKRFILEIFRDTDKYFYYIKNIFKGYKMIYKFIFDIY